MPSVFDSFVNLGELDNSRSVCTMQLFSRSDYGFNRFFSIHLVDVDFLELKMKWIFGTNF